MLNFSINEPGVKSHKGFDEQKLILAQKFIELIEPKRETFKETVDRLTLILKGQQIDSEVFWIAVKMIRQRYRYSDSLKVSE